MDQTRHFLLVDDDETNNLLCGFTLRKAFGPVGITSFTNPVEALAHIRNEYAKADSPPTVLFLDINMPQMTGWEFIDELITLDDAIQNKITLYMISSSVDLGDRERAASISKVTGYWSKPLVVDKLKALAAPPVG